MKYFKLLILVIFYDHGLQTIKTQNSESQKIIRIPHQLKKAFLKYTFYVVGMLWYIHSHRENCWVDRCTEDTRGDCWRSWLFTKQCMRNISIESSVGGRNVVGKGTAATEKTAVLRKNIHSGICWSFTRNKLRLKSEHQASLHRPIPGMRYK